MKKILFIEDQPDYKLHVFFCWLKQKNLLVEYDVVGSITEAKRYLANKNNKIDLVVTDLGLPIFTGERVKCSLQGMDIVFDMEDFNTEVPVIINSTTEVPNFGLAEKEYELRGQELYKVDSLLDMREWFMDFLAD